MCVYTHTHTHTHQIRQIMIRRKIQQGRKYRDELNRASGQGRPQYNIQRISEQNSINKRNKRRNEPCGYLEDKILNKQPLYMIPSITQLFMSKSTFMNKENKFESMLSKKCIIRSRNIKGNKKAHETKRALLLKPVGQQLSCPSIKQSSHVCLCGNCF